MNGDKLDLKENCLEKRIDELNKSKMKQKENFNKLNNKIIMMN